ncbi:MAG: hypothetical protein QXD73_04385 [Candidatus Bathyarchaeia archaeon]
MFWFKKLKIKKSEAEKAEANEPAETKPAAQAVEPSAQQSASPTPSEAEPLEELKPLIEKWRKACFDNAAAGIVDFTLMRQNGEAHAYYVLQRILKRGGGDAMTLIRDDLTVWRCDRTVVLTPQGYVGGVELEWQLLEKPQEHGITPEKVISLVKRVVGGETT